MEDDGILIIGAGIIGLSIAYYLSKSEEVRVTIVERGHLASEASRGNAGGIWPNLHYENRTMKEFGDLSMRLFEGLVDDGFNFEFRKNGVLELLPKEPEVEGVEEEIEEVRSHGYDIRFLSQEDVRTMEPEVSEDIGGAIYSPGDANANCFELASQLGETLKKKSVKIMEETYVKRMEVNEKRISSVETSSGKIRPSVIVNAAGPWSPSIGRMVKLSIPVEPAKGYMLSSSVREPIINAAVSNGDVVVTQRPNGVVRIGGTVEFVGFDKSVERRRVEAILDEAKEMLPKVSGIEIVDEWTGLRPCTADRLPIIGYSKVLTNLVHATGHFRRGFELAPATGKVVSELMINGSASIDISHMGPERFKSSHSL